MKLLQKERKLVVVSLLLLLMALVGGPVLAGGWAVVTLDSLPGEVHAGENIHLSFMVRQHGKEPVHFLTGPAEPMEPILTAFNAETGESLTIAAVREEEVGRFSIDVVFPSEGNWNWSIIPHPLQGATEFAPLTVLPALAAPSAGLQTTTSPVVEAAAPAAFDIALLLRGAAVVLLAGGALTAILAGRRKQQSAVVVNAGD